MPFAYKYGSSSFNEPVRVSLTFVASCTVMAYRRKHGPSRYSAVEDFRSVPQEESSSSPTSSLAAQAIRASAVHRDSSLSSAYGESAFSSAYRDSNLRRSSTFSTTKDSATYEYTSMKSLNESKFGFWGVLARKAKSILEDDNASQQFEDHGRSQLQMLDTSTGGQFQQSYQSSESYRKTENLLFHKGSESIASSLHQIGGTIRNALEEGLTIVENRTADIIHETRKLQIRRKTGCSTTQNQSTDLLAPNSLSQNRTDQETQLKASRDVANAMAAKAKLLLRELKTVKADLTFAKERCSQLEEENKLLRESREKGDNLEDDDLIRLQLETLLEEKGRLANENSIYARENRFLREVVEYHQLTMQDVIYVDEGIDEVTEVCPIQISPRSSPSASEQLSPIISSPTSPTQPNNTSPPSLNTEVAPKACPQVPTPPTSPSQGVPVDTNLATPPASPKPEGLRRQRSSTPPA